MSAPKDNTLAFPHDERDANGQFRQNLGMELRDWFAGQVVTGILNDWRYAQAGNEAACVYEVSRYAYMLADAMMEARKTMNLTPSHSAPAPVWLSDERAAWAFQNYVLMRIDRDRTKELSQLSATAQHPFREASEAVEKALTDLLFAVENADETGYGTDVGFLDLDKINEAARTSLSALAAAKRMEAGEK